MNSYHFSKKVTVSAYLLTVCLIFPMVAAAADPQEARPYPPERIPSEFSSEAPPSQPPISEEDAECLIEGTMSWDWWWGNRAYSLEEFVTTTGAARTSACLADIFEQVVNTCSTPGNFLPGLGFGPGSGTHRHYFDDCFVQTLSIRMFPDFNRRSSTIGTHSNGAVCTAPFVNDLKFCPASLGGVMGCTPCGQGRFYLNESCEVVPPNPDLEVCGSLTTNYQASTPISLLWDADEDIERNTTAVRFPLNPNLVGAWYQWKASASAPLLVYDPAHQGRVESAAQLFGEWTFGGKRVASLRQSDSLGGPWENGFEALATLDANGDGILEGDELKPLALWFDHNRDGVAQEGEVQSLQKMNVVRLFLEVDFKDPQTGSLWSLRGYERKIGERTVFGKSVDWFGVTGNSPFDVAAKLPKLPQLPQDEKQKQVVVADPDLSSETGSDTVDRSRLSGVWEFRFQGALADPRPAGYLVLSDHGDVDGSIRGYSVVNKEFRASGNQNRHGLVTVFPLEGEKEHKADSSQHLRFVINGEESEIRSSASVTADGSTMNGRSSVVTSEGSRITYSWTATRTSKVQ